MYFFFLVYVYVSVCISQIWRSCGTQFLPFAMWAPKIKLRLLDLVTTAFTCRTISPNQNLAFGLFYLKKNCFFKCLFCFNKCVHLLSVTVRNVVCYPVYKEKRFTWTHSFRHSSLCSTYDLGLLTIAHQNRHVWQSQTSH